MWSPATPQSYFCGGGLRSPRAMASTARSPILLHALAVGIAAAFLFSGAAPISVAATFPQGHHPGTRGTTTGEMLPAVREDPGAFPPCSGSVVSIPVGPYPLGVAYDSANAYVYVTGSVHNVTVINGTTGTVVGSVIVGGIPWGIAFDRSNGYLYVANTASNNVSVINGATNKALISVPVGFDPIAASYDSANGYVYVANWDEPNGNVTVINGATDSVVGSVPAGSDPNAVAYDSANEDVYVANFLSDNVTVINGANDTVRGSVSVGSWPRAVAYDSSNGYVYVANYDSNNVSVINGATDTVVGRIPVGFGPYGVAYDRANGNVYASNYDSDNVTAISGVTDTVVGSVPVGTGPDGLAYDGANECIYVANHDSGNVSVISAQASPLEANFSEGSTFTGTCQPFTENVSLMGSASGGVPPYQFTWYFGPGSSLSYGPVTNHTYTATGTYNVTLTVHDSVGDTLSVTQPVGVPPPSGCLPIVGGAASNLPWQFYVLLGGTLVGLALLAIVVWSRRK